MIATGRIRRVDDLGRIVIPKQIRETLNINEGDPLEFFYTKNEVILKKYTPGFDCNNQEVVDRDVIACYKNGDEIIIIERYPNGKYYVHYGYDEKSGTCFSTAGDFYYFYEAEDVLYSHRPNAVKLISKE